MIKEKSQELLSKLELKKGEKITIFEDGDYIGFSINKEYQTLKVIRNDGTNDLSCLVRIGYKESTKDTLKKLRLDCSIQSHSQREKFTFNGKIEQIKPENIETFNKGPIPFNLSSSHKQEYLFNSKDSKFIKNGKNTTLRKIVDEVYSTHLESLGSFNQLIYNKSTLILHKIFEWIIITFLYKGLHKFFHKNTKLKDEDFIELKVHYGHIVEISEDNFLGNVVPNKINISSIREDAMNRSIGVKLPLFGSDILINKYGLITGILILGILSLIYYPYRNDILGVIGVAEFYKNNEIILFVLFIIWIGLFHLLFEIMAKIVRVFTGGEFFTIILINIAIKLRKVILNSFYFRGFNYDTGNNPYN